MSLYFFRKNERSFIRRLLMIIAGLALIPMTRDWFSLIYDFEFNVLGVMIPVPVVLGVLLLLAVFYNVKGVDGW